MVDNHWVRVVSGEDWFESQRLSRMRVIIKHTTMVETVISS